MTTTEVENPKPATNNTDAPKTWHGNLHANVPAAIHYANNPWVSPAGEIVFNIRDNGQVWTYDLHE